MAREHMFNTRWSNEEFERATFVAEHYGLNIAGAIRMLFKREAECIAREGSAAPVATKTAKKASKRRAVEERR